MLLGEGMLKTDVALNYQHIPNDRHYRPSAQALEIQEVRRQLRRVWTPGRRVCLWFTRGWNCL